MAIVNVADRTLELKIVYYGCAFGGKTTNVVMLPYIRQLENRKATEMEFYIAFDF